ncbi:sigma-70 family RNA polymerase sigma factor [Paenibacillus sp. MBLB4367]|uniref:sigma-70 family RNA polymerase sigma factor n=1 Tax=Paenibacillus sp. MBLB4367 TaxID=3384767 RepID=UPI003908373D
MSVEEWVKAAKENDETAFFRLMELHREQAYRIAFAYLRNEQEALDAVQETTFRAYRQLAKLKEPQYFTTWLIRILLNYCHDQAKKRRRWHPFSRIESEQAVAARPIDREAKIDIDIAMNRLKPKYKQVVILKYFEDLTVAEVARVIGRPEGTVKTRLHQALSQLRVLLGKEEEHDV